MKKLQSNQRIFGIGLSRTGTTSLAEALCILGIKTIHYPDDDKTYAELRSGNYNLSILNEYQAVIDIPVAPYYAQLDKLYPDSKFILTIRDEESWLRSIESYFGLLEKWWDRDAAAKKFGEFITACTYGAVQFNRDRFLYVYDTHVRNVRAYFATRPSDFLSINIIDGQGWQTLCAFLGLPVPDVSFPHLNRGDEVQNWMHQLFQAEEEIMALIRPEETFILVDEGKLCWSVAGHRYVPFLEHNGRYCGPPPEEDTGIRELERLRQSGMRFMVFAWPAFSWLDNYPQLALYLRTQFRCVLNNARLVVFDLRV
jgi:hypothetical protein